jgi:hypothetical protein
LSAARGKNDDAGAALVREGAQDYLLRGRPDPALLARAVRHIAASRSLASAAAESDARYQRLLASVTDYTYSVVVENGRAVSSRHGPGCAAVTGYASEEYEADPQLWYRMVLDADRPSVLEMASQVLAGGARRRWNTASSAATAASAGSGTRRSPGTTGRDAWPPTTGWSRTSPRGNRPSSS